MPATTPTGKASKGTCQLRVSNNRLQLRYREPDGYRRVLSLGLPDTKLNRDVAKFKIAEIERDLSLGVYKGYQHYKPNSHLSLVDAPPAIKLLNLWDSYTDYRRNQVAPTTIKVQYEGVRKRLVKCSLDSPIAVRDWLLKHYSVETTRRTIVQLNACLKWAKKSGLVSENGFSSIVGDIKKAKGSGEIDCFSKVERDFILEALKSDKYCSRYSAFKHSFYYPHVWLLFELGLRSEELVPLTYGDVSPDFTKVKITKARPYNSNILKTTKTGKPRTIPISPKITEFLKTLKPSGASKSTLICGGARGGYWDVDGFLARVWRPVINGLVEAGEVDHYQPLVNCRHSFATYMLEAGLTVTTVSRLMGNSPAQVLSAYASTMQQIKMPEV